MEGVQHHETEYRFRLRNLWKNKIMKYILRLKMQGDLKKLLRTTKFYSFIKFIKVLFIHSETFGGQNRQHSDTILFIIRSKSFLRFSEV